jgi:hypothetical protein
MTVMSGSIQKIKRVPLRELWRKEDKDFTKWLEEHIDFLNDAIGFDISIESREEKVGPFKVDLYGEDNFGNKVIIENQLEKTDHNHLGQLITYLTNLGANIAIWICKEPTEEHMKAIDWLNEVSPDDISFYLIKLEAIRIGDDSPTGPLFIVVKRPTTEKKQIGLEKKEYAQRHVFREKFWIQFLTEINKKNSLFANISPSTDNWIGIGMGRGGFNLNLVISKKYARAEIYINRGEMEDNKKAFDSLYAHKDEIEKEFGGKLTWERMEDNVTSRIKHQLDDVNVTNEEDWPKMNEFMIDEAEKMQRAFKDPIRKLKA